MLTSRKALMSNLNYLQHVSLGIHLSMHPEVTDAPRNQDTDVRHGCHQKWKDTTMVDPNSNDPSMPCLCCDQHPRQEASLQYSSLDDLDTILGNECLSPDDLPLSPLSLYSPSTDSSSSSDFTLDDSPVSIYYKEYSQDGLDTPDHQPDIIPLDAVTEGPFSPCLSSQEANATLNSKPSETNKPEIMNNNNMELEDTPFIDWGTDSMVDSNSDTLIESPLPDMTSGSSSMESDTIVEPETQENKPGQPDSAFIDHWPEEDNLLPGLPFLENTSTPTPKKTITSFHELALRRRKSGGQLPAQPKKDRSDWLIIFSPDSEQPPLNEMTASAFYHGIVEPPTHPMPAGKEVTTFRELRYRNTLNKQTSVQQIKVNEERGYMSITEATTEASSIGDVLRVAWKPKVSQKIFTEETELEDAALRERNDQGSQCSRSPVRTSGPKTANACSMREHTLSGPGDPLTATRNEDNSEKETTSTAAESFRRGMADGGDRRIQEVAECELLMADEAEDSAQWKKKSLLIDVGSSVEKIICHFNTSRNQVQKAQLGDSRLSPVLGYLILNHLCPSLYSLLGDGLKPYQKDVIVGRRRLSPWSLVEASSKTGPENVHLLFSKVNRLTQLRDPQRRFNAFIFGLLNMKQLDVWLLHLHQTYDELCLFFLPSGFLPLAATLNLELRDELLLTLQPLSALTFHTDLLFEHHHLSLQDVPTPHGTHSPGRGSNNWAVPSLQDILDLGGWITQNLTGNAENKTPSPKSLHSPRDKRSANGSQPDRCALAADIQQDTAQHSSSGTKEPMTDNISPALTPSNWWGQLSQASRIYIPAKQDLLNFTTLRKRTSPSPMDKELNQRESSSENTAFPKQRRSEEMTSGGATQSPASGNDTRDNLGATYKAAVTQEMSDGNSCSAGAERVKARPTMDGGRGQYPNHENRNWLGQLFGASFSSGREMEVRTSKSRRPSSWLPPNVNMWNLIRKQSTPVTADISFHDKEEHRQRDNSRPQRSLRALCDHAASGEAQLSFKKGDVLQLLGTVDEDWIRCRRGSDTGFVPVGYTSLIL